MICIKCDHDLDQYTCPDAAERIRMVLTSKYLHIGDEYKARLLAHAAEMDAKAEKGAEQQSFTQ